MNLDSPFKLIVDQQAAKRFHALANRVSTGQSERLPPQVDPEQPDDEQIP